MTLDAYAQLVSHLAAWSRRRRLRDAAVWVPRGASLGLLLAAVVALLARFRPLVTNQELALIVLLLTAAGVLLGTLFVLLRRYTLLEQARFADQHLALKERLSTAVEIEQGQTATSPALARLQLHDALSAAERIDAVRAFPVKWNVQDWLAGLLLLALLLTAVFWQNPQAAILLQQRAVAEAVAEQRAEVERLAEDIRQNPELTEAQQETLLEPLEEALAALDGENISQEEALAALSEAETELRELGSAAESNPAAEALAEAADRLGAEAAADMETGDAQAAAAGLDQLARQLSELGSAERAALADELAAAADEIAETDPQLADSLREAAEALGEDDLAAAEAALEASAAQMAENGEQAATTAEEAAAAADRLAQGREAVAEAGQSGQQSQAEAVAGEGEAAGASGESAAGSEAATNGGQQGDSPQQGNGPAIESGGSAGGPGRGGGHSEDVFVPELRNLGDVAGVDVELPAECRANPAQCGSLRGETPTELGQEGSTVPYVQVFGDYLDVANEALEGDYIPLGLKDYVRDYFSSLEPSS